MIRRDSDGGVVSVYCLAPLVQCVYARGCASVCVCIIHRTDGQGNKGGEDDSRLVFVSALYQNAPADEFAAVCGDRRNACGTAG